MRLVVHGRISYKNIGSHFGCQHNWYIYWGMIEKTILLFYTSIMAIISFILLFFQSNVRCEEKQCNRDFSDIFLNGGDIAQKSRFFDMISSDPIIQAA